MKESEPDASRVPVAIELAPLRWMHAEDFGRLALGEEPNAENLLHFLRGPYAGPDFIDFVARYKTLTAHDAQLFAAPVNATIARGILQPIHNAKAAFVLGHFPSCIGLCGVAAEMLAVFRFDISEVQLGKQALDEPRQKLLWGSSFEDLSQSKRSKALRALELIDEESLRLFSEVAGIRNKYVHALAARARNERADAETLYAKTVRIAVKILGLGIDGTTLVLHQDVLRFLARGKDPRATRGKSAGGPKRNPR